MVFLYFSLTWFSLIAGLVAKHRGDIIKAHLPGCEGNNVGFDHRMYCKVLSEEEVEKQTLACEQYFREEEEEEISSDEEGSDYSEYESSSSCSRGQVTDPGPERVRRERRAPTPLFDDILGRLGKMINQF